MPDAREHDSSKIEAYIPLPDDPRYSRGAARESFEGIAVAYDQARPGYPPDLFAALDTACGLNASDRILEIGCGTGQATRSLAERGCEIHCVELGGTLAAIAHNHLARYPNVTIEVVGFEDADLGAEQFDLVFSATAFHWIDPAIGYPKAAAVLRPSGYLALVTNTHVAGGTQDLIAGAVQNVHQAIAPEVGPWQFATIAQIAERAEAASSDIAVVWSRVDRSFVAPPQIDDLFEPPTVSLFPWIADYDTDGFLAMLATQSIYILMEPQRRDDLLAGIGQIVDEHLDGHITKQYLAILATARRRA